jgi:excisionase family DNA binding protein
VPPFVDTQTPNPLVLSLPDELVEAVAQRAAEIVRESEPESDEWLTTQDAADHLKCGKRRIFNLVSEGRIPVHREGARLLFLKSELDEWIRSGRAMAA